MDQPTNQDILEAINSFAQSTEDRLGRLETDVSSLTSDVSSLKSDVSSIKVTMVTKDFLTDKLADLRGDLVVLLRKEDNKFGALVAELLKEKVISQDAAKRILQMEPFPHLAL